KSKVNRISRSVNGDMKLKSENDREKFRDSHLLLKSTMTRLQQEGDGDMNRVLEELVKKNDSIVSVYILDSSGKQRSKRLAGKAADTFGLRVLPSAVGSDHSAQDYFTHLNSGFEKSAGEHSPDALCSEKYNFL
ncbi:EAL domain-containing protein, partial [Aduncisulcus paluster]